MKIAQISRNINDYRHNQTSLACQPLRNNGYDEFVLSKKNKYIPSFNGMGGLNKLTNFFRHLIKPKHIKTLKPEIILPDAISKPLLSSRSFEFAKEIFKEQPDIIKFYTSPIYKKYPKYCDFLTFAVSKHPELKKQFMFEANLPINFITKNSLLYDKKLNTGIFEKIKEISGSGIKADAIMQLLESDEKINWAAFIPQKLNKENANCILDNLYEILSLHQRLDSMPYQNWHLWAARTKNLTEYATSEIKTGTGLRELLADIGHGYSTLFKEEGIIKRGTERTGEILFTPYGKGIGYEEYANKFDSLMYQRRPAPYNGVELTRISSKTNGQEKKNIMLHPDKSTLYASVNKAEEFYQKILETLKYKKYTGKLNFSDVEKINENIARIAYILYNAVPFDRGSAGIISVLVRALQKSADIPVLPVKKNIALDLEAFCNDIDDYIFKWLTYFEPRPEV